MWRRCEWRLFVRGVKPLCYIDERAVYYARDANATKVTPHKTYDTHVSIQLVAQIAQVKPDTTNHFSEFTTLE
jgi:hypothetical protein